MGVLDWFASLWDIAADDYWGYVTSGTSEGNMYGILLGREMLPDAILYTSAQSHHGIVKVARILRMECIVVPA